MHWRGRWMTFFATRRRKVCPTRTKGVTTSVRLLLLNACSKSSCPSSATTEASDRVFSQCVELSQ